MIRDMSKPRHRRCGVCNVVTARYARTQNAGAFTVQIWAGDPTHGEVLTKNGTVVRCRAHAEQDTRCPL